MPTTDILDIEKLLARLRKREEKQREQAAATAAHIALIKRGQLELFKEEDNAKKNSK